MLRKESYETKYHNLHLQNENDFDHFTDDRVIMENEEDANDC